MTLSSFCLLLGGVASLLIVLLHLALALRPRWYRHFGADELAQMHEQGSRFTVFATLGLALIFAVWGIYALSGAGVIGQLPLLRALLITIGVIYVLRSLMLPSELFNVLLRGYPFRFVVFSTGSLAAGLLHLIGTLAR
ncbi:MAG: hypothetical protein P8189_28290 [Anaerolineae bacterium]|jgi:putative oxidoreductase